MTEAPKSGLCSTVPHHLLPFDGAGSSQKSCAGRTPSAVPKPPFYTGFHTKCTEMPVINRNKRALYPKQSRQLVANLPPRAARGRQRLSLVPGERPGTLPLPLPRTPLSLLVAPPRATQCCGARTPSPTSLQDQPLVLSSPWAVVQCLLTLPAVGVCLPCGA